MTLPTRWQDCTSFKEALIKRGYLTFDEANNEKTLMADSVYLCMYELWQDGLGAKIETVGPLEDPG